MHETDDESFQRDLRVGEALVWVGRPQPGMRLRSEDAILVPFSLLWGGFAIFWEFGVITSGKSAFMAIWGVPFVLAGLYLMFGRFLIDARIRARTTYAVTSERILIRTGVVRTSLHSYQIAQLPDLRLSERREGLGTIDFQPGLTSGRWSRGSRSGPWQACPPWRLEDIEDVRGVYECIVDLQRPERPHASSPTSATANGSA